MFTYQSPVTPAEVGPVLRELIDELVVGAAPIYVDVLPLDGAPVNECFLVVAEHVKKNGGSCRVGWALWEFPGLFVEAEFHAIWDDGNENFLDITPKSSPSAKVLFIEDPEKEFKNIQINNVRKPLNSDANLIEYLKTFTEMHELMNRGDRSGGFGEVTLSGDEAREYQNIVQRQASSFMQIARNFKKAGPYLPCPCGSGKKIKWCHKHEYLNS